MGFGDGLDSEIQKLRGKIKLVLGLMVALRLGNFEIRGARNLEG